MVEVGKFYVNNPNRPSRFYYILGKSSDDEGFDYDYIMWDEYEKNIKFASMEWLIDSNPFIIRRGKLKYIFIQGTFQYDQRNK